MGSGNFESTRVELAKTAIQQNNFTTDQIKLLLSFFTFESSKLEVAKLAYAKTIDRQNYFRIFDAFAFDSSIRELNDFMIHCS